MTGMWEVLGTKVGFRGWRITVRTDRILNPAAGKPRVTSSNIRAPSPSSHCPHPTK